MNVSVKDSGVQGKGVFAEKGFLKDEVILEIDDSHIVEDVSALTDYQQEYDCDYLSDGKTILMQSPEKFINHSCDPSTYIKTIRGKRKVFAMKNIKKGEEITYDYSINGYNDGTFECNCRNTNCRKVYQGNFFKLPKDIQLKYLPYLDSWFMKEHQEEINKLKKSN